MEVVDSVVVGVDEGGLDAIVVVAYLGVQLADADGASAVSFLLLVPEVQEVVVEDLVGHYSVLLGQDHCVDEHVLFVLEGGLEWDLAIVNVHLEQHVLVPRQRPTIGPQVDILVSGLGADHAHSEGEVAREQVLVLSLVEEGVVLLGEHYLEPSVVLDVKLEGTVLLRHHSDRVSIDAAGSQLSVQLG